MITVCLDWHKMVGPLFSVVLIAPLILPTTTGYAQTPETAQQVVERPGREPAGLPMNRENRDDHLRSRLPVPGLGVKAAGHPEFAEGEVLVKFKDRTSPETAVKALNSLNLAGVRSIASYDRIGVQRLKLPEGTSVKEAVGLLNADENTEYAEPNYIYRTCDTLPNDPDFEGQWGMHKIDAPAAWDITTGSSTGLVIAVIDTGVDYTHLDLAANMWQNPGEVPGNDEDDDGNGYVDDVYGIDSCTYGGHIPDSDPMDDNGHGTHCAGTIGAVGNNGIGVAGVNWTAQIMALKWLDSSGFGKVSDVIEALNYVIDMKENRGVNLRVTSNSWGGVPYSNSLYDAIAAAGAADILFVAAAGNDAWDNDVYPVYPASYDLENIIAVAATDQDDNLAFFSCYGATSVDLGAPGVDIISTTPGDNYKSYNGTSMAAPHVSGAAALVLAQNPDYSDLWVKRAIMESVDLVEALDGKTVTGGRLNAHDALVVTLSPEADIQVHPAQIELALLPDTIESHPLRIRNTGDLPLTYEIDDGDSPWLDQYPTSGSIQAFDAVEIGLTIDTNGLDPGQHFYADITIANNDLDENPTIVPVHLGIVISGIVYVDADATGNNDGSSWPNAFTDLQEGLFFAGPGAEIWVAAGTYTPSRRTNPLDPRTASFQLRNDVALYGGFDPSVGDTEFDDRDWENNVTILSGDLGEVGDDSDNCYHVFYHPDGSNLDSTAILDGFTITGGNADGTYPDSRGGGMYNGDSSPTVTNCTFFDSKAMYGGGMYNGDSSPTVTNCAFFDNSAAYGGGMENVGSSPTVTNCSFHDNSVSIGGGGMDNYSNSSPSVTNCTFLANSSDSYGGGMYNEDSSPTLANCTFDSNTAEEAGGGMDNYKHSSPALSNCTFVGNSANLGGGMENFMFPSPTLTNCTFWRNSASNGGGMYNDGYLIECVPTLECVPKLTNCTFFDNEADFGGGIYNYVNSPIVTNSIFWGDTGNELYSTGPSFEIVSYCDIDGGYSGTSSGPGNIDADPLFVDPGKGDFHLQLGSPCIDSGTNSAPDVAIPEIDFEGDARPADGNGDGVETVDMGVDEGLPVICVDAGATGANDGSSWADAYTDLQDALSAASYPANIWVAEGTYRPTARTNFWDPRTATFQLANDVAIYGGFPSGGSPTGSDRDWENNITILDGDLNGNGRDNNDAYHVVYSTGVGRSAILDGFTITGGNATGWSAHASGGGMYNYMSSPTVRNCTFTDNEAYLRGGGMYNKEASPEVRVCNFRDNSAWWAGGGMYNYNSSATVINSTFTDNAAYWRGGGMSNKQASPVVANCTFWSNYSQNGGGMSNKDSSPVVTNCILWGNSGDEIHDLSSSSIVTYCDVEGGYSGEGNINEDPRFVDAANGDFHLRLDSPCMNAGYNDAVSGIDHDFEGDPRIMNCVVDMGIDEAEISEVWVDDDWAGAGPGDPVDGHVFGRDAFASISDAVDYVETPGTVNVGAGAYVENISMKSGVEIVGAGPGDDPASHSILDAGGNGSVVTAFNVDSEARLHGFSITNGFAVNGGGIYLENSSPTISECFVASNTATEKGGGIYNYESSPVLTDCSIYGNSAGEGGGGLSNEESSSPTLTNCWFYDNEAELGGGMYNDGRDYEHQSSPTVSNCSFDNNTATEGGGLYIYRNCYPTLSNCSFYANSADVGGGIRTTYYSRPSLTNCAFDSNTAAQVGGGMANYLSYPALDNCSFDNNTAVDAGGGMFNETASQPKLTNCSFQGNEANEGGGMANEGSIPTLTDCIFDNNTAGDAGGGIFNNESPPKLTNCSFQNNQAGEGGGMASYCYSHCYSKPTLTNCSFQSNQANRGGGIYNYNLLLMTLTNCTFMNDYADIEGAGMYTVESSVVVTNSIFWSDYPGEYDGIYPLDVQGVSYSDVQGGYLGTGNIDADPQFVDGDFPHLQPGSPCIDAGDNSAVYPPYTDFEGDDRIIDGDSVPGAVVDMGVDEYSVP